MFLVRKASGPLAGRAAADPGLMTAVSGADKVSVVWEAGYAGYQSLYRVFQEYFSRGMTKSIRQRGATRYDIHKATVKVYRPLVFGNNLFGHNLSPTPTVLSVFVLFTGSTE